MPMDPSKAYSLLKSNPESFLRTYSLTISSSYGTSGINYFVLENRGDSFRPGSVLGTKKWHATEAFRILPERQHDVKMPGQRFSAHVVHMAQSTATNLGLYRLGTFGPGIMVTGQLTGCSFVVESAGNNEWDVGHIRPVGGVTPQALPARLSTTFPNAFIYGATGRWGFYQVNGQAVSILGIRTGSAWKIYAQKQDRSSSDTKFRILSVYKLNDGHRKV